ncbi:hypothetical protein V502_06413 [Pseudogymnoascus sp. VKM F-4520 (FW-2644)]|nr:hypothetical protein V502_06413 [Pseudogymnoascus sp. VKM F-4520 (FW-2644)]
MSVSTYSIQVYNDSGIPQNYLLFQSAPQLSGDATVFTNVYQQSQQIPSGDGSNVTFNMTNQYYAVIGTAPTPIDKGVKVNTSSYIPVQLSSASQGGTKAVMTTSGGGTGCSFDDSAQTLESDIENTFEIETDDSFGYPSPGNIFLGMGAQSPSGVVPVASVSAAPNQKYYFNPVARWYIGTGTYTPGTVVNITDIGNIQECDFTYSQLPQTYYQGPDQLYHSGSPPS